MQYIYTVFTLIILLSICWFLGQTAGFFKIKMNPFIFGFVLLNALFYVLAFPFMFFKGRLVYLTVIFSAVIAVIILAVIVSALRRSGREKEKERHRVFNKEVMVCCIAAAVIIAMQVILSFVLVHYDADDSYYIARTSTMLHTGVINSVEPSTGFEGMRVHSQYVMVGYEVMMAVLCSIFRINAAWMYHTVIVPVLLILHYIVMYELGKALFSKHAHMFLLAVAVINTFSGYSVYSRGAFALFRIWQGKSVMVNIMMPVMMLVFAWIIKNRDVLAEHCVLLTMILIGGLNLSAVAIYLLPIQYAMYFITYVLSGIGHVKENIKSIFLLMVPVICELPLVCVIYFFKLRGDAVSDAAVGIEEFSYTSILSQINGCGYAIGFVIIAVVMFGIFGRGHKRLLFGLYPVICVITALNPVFAKYIARYITGVPVFWRMFWIVGMSYIIAAAIISLYCYKKMFGIAASVLILALSGHIIYIPDSFSVADNIEKIDAAAKWIADIGEEEGIEVAAMLPEDIGYGIRQYSGKTKLVWSRYSSALYEEIGKFDDISYAYNKLYSEKLYTPEIKEILLRYGAEYVLLYKDTKIFYRDKDGILNKMGGKVWSNEEYVLYGIH